MNATIPTTTRSPADRRKDDLLEAAVGTTISKLQRGHRERRPAAAATLARLRRAVTREPGSVPDVWGDTIGALDPSLLGKADTPSAFERAAHAALTLYAVHQQSRVDSMHERGAGLGRAVRELRVRKETATQPTDAVIRRFHILATATSFPETLHHLRGTVTQLRGEGIPLDYARLAVDLRRLQSGATADSVRLAWGRDLHRATPREERQSKAAPSESAEPGETT